MDSMFLEHRTGCQFFVEDIEETAGNPDEGKLVFCRIRGIWRRGQIITVAGKESFVDTLLSFGGHLVPADSGARCSCCHDPRPGMHAWHKHIPSGKTLCYRCKEIYDARRSAGEDWWTDTMPPPFPYDQWVKIYHSAEAAGWPDESVWKLKLSHKWVRKSGKIMAGTWTEVKSIVNKSYFPRKR